MLRSLRLRDYQSHKDTSLELGKLTVIVGPSSSGKTAIARALRLLANNARGVSYVRQGAKKTCVSAEVAGSEPVSDASTHVTVERAKATSAYELTLPGDPEPVQFTKCGTSTPELVQSALPFGGDGMWLAGQFDRPFLLDETGSQVARTLGELTNVNLIFAAVRECNRRAAEHKRRATDQESELSDLRMQIQQYRDLPQRREWCKSAEQGTVRVRDATERRDRIMALVAEAADASQRVSQARVRQVWVPSTQRLASLAEQRRSLAEATESVLAARQRRDRASARLCPVPDVTRAEDHSRERSGLVEALQHVASARQRRDRARQATEAVTERATEVRAELGLVLQRAGVCPTCGAAAEHAQPARVAAPS